MRKCPSSTGCPHPHATHKEAALSSAGPGTFTALQPDVDGVFLGRFAHDIKEFAAVLDEVNDCRTNNP